MVDETTETGGDSLWSHLKRDRWPIGPRSLAAVAVVGLFLGSAVAPSFAAPKEDKKAQEAAKKAAHDIAEQAKKAAEAAKKAAKQQSSQSSSDSYGACTEDAFVSQVIPPGNSPVIPGSVIGVTYDDETNLNVDSVVFTFDGQTYIPGQGVTLDPSTGGKYVHITFQVPSDLLPGSSHEASVYAEDLDQNKTGGDCGFHMWDFTVGENIQVGNGGNTNH